MQYNIISNYLNYCQTVKRLSSHTVRAYANDLNHFYQSDIKDVNSYLEYLTSTVQKSSTLRRKIATIKAFYRYLEDEEIINENPLRFRYFKINVEKKLPKTIPLSDLNKIFIYLKESVEGSRSSYSREIAYRNWLLLSLLFSTGLRISELCQLEIDRINCQDRIISILGKGKKERSIYLGDDKTVELLNYYLKHYHMDRSFFLFPGKSENSCLSDQNVRRILRDLSRKLNLSRKVTPHMFRHTFATMLLDNDVDIRYIQQILGHSSIAITQIYTHVSYQKQKEILTKSNPLSLLVDRIGIG